MKLYMTHTIQFGPLDLPQSDILNELAASLSTGRLQSRLPLSEGLSKYFCRALLFVDTIDTDGATTAIEKSELTVFEGGFGTLQTISNVSETITAPELIKVTEDLTNFIEQKISVDANITKICKAFGNWFTEDETDYSRAKLMWAYSQVCVFETAINFKRFSNALSDKEEFVYSDCRVKFDPTATCIFFTKKERIDSVKQLVISVTLSTALAYNIQHTALKLSRKILEKPSLETQFSSIDKYVRLVNVMDQYLAELEQDSLNGNLNEVAFAKPLASAFELSNLLNQSFKAVSRLKDHVLTLENDISRKQRTRMNNILFTFTLLSVISISGSLISLYDFTNNISPKVRIFIVFSTFSLTSAAVIILLRRLGSLRS